MKRKIISVILSVLLIVGALPQALFCASAAEGVEYRYFDTATMEFKTGVCTSYTLVDSTVNRWGDGWYVVDGKFTIGSGGTTAILVTGDAKVILKDGCEMYSNGTIQVDEGRSLTVYAQSDGDNKGKLRVDASENQAGIGGGSFENSGDVTIHGGKLTVNGSNGAAGIGGADGYSGGNVTVYGGYITVQGGSEGGSAIGSGAVGLISSGDAGTFTMYGGYVDAYGYHGAGIGGGFRQDGGTVRIYGGTLEAKSMYGTAIGGGNGGSSMTSFDSGGNGGDVAIYGGSVIAETHAEDSAAIGGSVDGNGGTFALYGGNVKIKNYSGGKGVGSGDDYHDNGPVILSDGLIIIDNETGKPFADAFSKDFKALFRKSEVDVSALTSAEFPEEYLLHYTDGTVETKNCSDYKMLYKNMSTWSDGWYVMSGSGTFTSGIAVTGNVNLLLLNDCELTVNGSIGINEDCSLTVYAQPQTEGSKPGKLTVNGNSYFPAIGNWGSFTVQGGEIIANGGSYGAGIGGEYAGAAAAIDIAIFDGSITAVGGAGAAGIGGCYQGHGCDVKIYGGSITASGGTYFNVTCRGIGGGMNMTDHGSLKVENGLYLKDNTTGKIISRGFNLTPWLDLLDGTSVSFTVVSEDAEKEPVSYRYYDKESGEYKTGICENYTVLDKTVRILTSGWYVLEDSGTTNFVPVASGDVHIILKDNCTLESIGGIRVTDDNSLTIYAQSEGEDAGAIIADSSDNQFSSGIGGGVNQTPGSLTIHGGNIIANGGMYSAGIGGGSTTKTGSGFSGCDTVIYGGEIHALGGAYGAGIGGGIYGDGGNTAIYGGTVEAVGGVNGGAGIGSGYCKVEYDAANAHIVSCGSAGKTDVYGGTVYAQGGYDSAGIGGGYGGDGGTATFYGGSVTAVGGENADGIGTGWFDYETEHLPVADSEITVYSDDVTSNGRKLPSTIEAIAAVNETCTTDGLAAYMYDTAKKIYFDGDFELIGDAAAFADWCALPVSDGGGLIPATGHKWEYSDETNHICIICRQTENHDDSDGDLLCDGCGHNICTHENRSIQYTWDYGYIRCKAVQYCDDCNKEMDSVYSDSVEFIETNPGINCRSMGKACYEATFPRLAEPTRTESKFDTQFGPHIDADRNDFCDICKRLTRREYSYVTEDTEILTQGVWLLDDSIINNNNIIVSGIVKLYLADFSYIKVLKGITVPTNCELTVISQSDGAQTGRIIATGTSGAAGIGGALGEESGYIVIKGGDIFATGGKGAAGIGGGFGSYCDYVTIEGGRVTAQGNLAPAIGSGCFAEEETPIEITGDFAYEAGAQAYNITSLSYNGESFLRITDKHGDRYLRGIVNVSGGVERDAHVNLIDPASGQTAFSVRTDDTNVYYIDNAENGTYLLEASYPGAVTRTYTVTIDTDRSVSPVELYTECDVNGDGEIDINDYQLAVNIALGSDNSVTDAVDLSADADYMTAVADVNGDKFADVLDVILIERKINAA